MCLGLVNVRIPSRCHFFEQISAFLVAVAIDVQRWPDSLFARRQLILVGSVAMAAAIVAVVAHCSTIGVDAAMIVLRFVMDFPFAHCPVYRRLLVLALLGGISDLNDALYLFRRLNAIDD